MALKALHEHYGGHEGWPESFALEFAYTRQGVTRSRSQRSNGSRVQDEHVSARTLLGWAITQVLLDPVDELTRIGALSRRWFTNFGFELLEIGVCLL